MTVEFERCEHCGQYVDEAKVEPVENNQVWCEDCVNLLKESIDEER